MELLAFQIVFMGIFGGVCAAIASSKGRSVIGWFFGGFFLGIIGIVIVAVLPNLAEQRRKEQAIERENRRLREQLVQEQIKTEAFRQHASARLDAHDGSLGIDIRSASQALAGPGHQQALPEYDEPQSLSAEEWLSSLSGSSPAHQEQAEWPAPEEAVGNSLYVSPGVRDNPPPLPAAAVPAAPAVTSARQWFFEDRGETRGPLSDRQLVALAKSGQIVGTTLGSVPKVMEQAFLGIAG